MNRVFRIVWSTALHAWVVASELTGRHGKGRGRSAAMTTDQRPASRHASIGSPLRLGILVAMAMLYAPVALSSTDLYWDVNGGTAGSGGTGTWNTSLPFWNSASDGVAGPFVNWDNSALNNAWFSGTAGTVTLGTPITVQNLNFTVTGYTLTGSTLTLAGTTPTISAAGVATISSVLAGSAGLTKTGASQLTLTGTNTFTGAINVSAGTLAVSTDAGLGNASNSITLAAGTGLTSTGVLASSRVVTLSSGSEALRGGVGSAQFTGAGSAQIFSGVTMSNATSNYTGTTSFAGGGSYAFTSVADLGVASSLGAPTTEANGLISVAAGAATWGTLSYTGTGSTSNRDWLFQNSAASGNSLVNNGTGTLTLTGNIGSTSTGTPALIFQAASADIALQGVLSASSSRLFEYNGSAGRTITLGNANTYTGGSSIIGITVKAGALADTGTASSFGTGTAAGISISSSGTLSYTGAGSSSNRPFTIDGVGTISNDGTGALALSGATAFTTGGAAGDTLALAGSYTGTSTFSGVISGTGNVSMSGAGTWELDGVNTYAGTTTVQSGTLRLGAGATLGASTGLVVNGGLLDLNSVAITAPSLAGTGGAVNLGSSTLTLKSASGSTSYAGSIGGTGGLTKLGASTQTLTGANTYTGATTVGGGTLALDFSVAAAPASNIISGASTLNLGGGTLSLKGAAAANSQAFNGLNVTAGNNRITATAGSGGSFTLSLGAINRSGGLADFDFNTGASITTTQADGALGGWATVNGTDYAEVSGGVITAFTNYANKDDASQWLAGDIVSDAGGNANTPYFGTVNGSLVLGGLKYTANAASTVNVGAGNTLGIDGTILVTSTVASSTQTIQGGSVSGGPGGALGVQQNSAGTFTIASVIADGGTPTSFTVGGSGTGSVVVTGANTYTGGTTMSGGTLNFNSVADGGQASAIGASTADPSNLMLENGTLRYTGATASTDRGFTLVNGGTSRTIEVDGTSDLTFSGQVTSPDDAGFTKTGTGTLTLTNATNDFVGPVTVSGGTLAAAVLADGGQASSIGAGTNDPSNLVLQSGGALEYTGATNTTDRGFTLGTGGGQVAVDQAATTLTDSGTVIGAGGLTKNGAGTLVLSGANTYTGGTIVNAGTLQAGSAQAFGGQAGGTGAGSITVAAGATLDLNNLSVWVGGLAGAGNVTLGTGTLLLNGSGTFTGNVSGTGGVTMDATSALATQVMNGCGNSYTGPTTIEGGQLSTDCLANGGQNSGIGASSSAPANLTMNNGTLVYTGATVSTDRGIQLTGAGTVSVSNAATTLTVSGSIQGAGGLTKQGAGTLVLTNANTYTGGTSIAAGTLRAGVNNAFGGGILSLSNVAGALLDLNSFTTSAYTLIGGGTTGGNVNLGSATLTITSGNAYLDTGDFAGAISGSGNIVKGGSGINYFSGVASTYTGVTTINSGTLAVNSLANGGQASSIGASSNSAANLVLNGGRLQYLGTGGSTDRLFTLGPSSSLLDASGTGAIAFTNTGAISFSGAANTAQTVTITGTSTANNSLALQIADNGTGKTSLNKTSTGTWILNNAASSYTGVTNIAGGVLGVAHLANGGQASSLGASSNAASNLIIGNGATLLYTGTGDTTDRLFTLSAGTSVIDSSGTGAIVFSNTNSAASSGAGNRTLGLGGTNTGNNTMGGAIIDGTGGVTTLAKNDAGTWLLTGNNTYTGNTVVNAGILQLGNGGTSGSVASASIIVAAGTLAFDRSDTLEVDGTISAGPISSGNVVQSGTGTTVLTAANTYTGGTSITAGTLQLGNGAASGSILGDVSDNGTFAIDRSDVYTFGNLISGSGGFTQLGSGTTVLTDANTYTGATNVQAGTLLVDGDQSAATGATTVQNGAMLGGAGTLGGNVTVANGGVLSPGDAGAAGTLTINGSLTLNSGSTLNYQFGQANVAGGALNDLTVVHGNLTLDGTLNVSATPGGSFGPGLYRIISYDGTLNDQGLALGTAPGGPFQVQTAVANQVNLLNSGGLTLNFWDGPNGHGNNAIDGGTGVWQNSTGNDNWTNQTGQYNAPYTDGQFGIFMGTPGTVTVDDTLGAVTSSGMQFAVNGYTVTGDAITLNGGPSIIRVGDGTAAGASMTATISAPLIGTGGLEKEDLGTLVLAGANTYTGGTTISAGTLQISSDTNLGDASGGLSIDGGTLRNTAAITSARGVTIGQSGATFDTQADLELSGVIGGAGALTKTSAGTLTLDGSNSYQGGTSINGGTVSISSDTNLGDASGALALNGGTLQNTAAVTSARGVTLGSGGGTFDTQNDLELDGLISGSGALTKIDGGSLVLAADNSYTGGTTVSGGTLQLGNGGSAGSVAGDIANNGTVVFDRSDVSTYAGTISGIGAVEQQGSGTIVLSGNNSYTGSTDVRAGSLVINGDQSAATGLTSVDSGGTLGGMGTIGGDVTVADGGTLSPGNVGTAPGTLSIKGSLALSGTSNLNVDFGQANIVGGPLNDLVQVTGNLTLDGTLNVSVSSGGNFDPGIYRIISYGGTLTDNGLNIGTVPTPDYELQTSIAQQVNLVNTNGLAVNFWDGNGARGDGIVEGGNGVWQNAAGNDNWTVVDGSINAQYQDSSFAIFAAAPGTVTVDASLGAINSVGMQFATDGYRIEGDSIALVGSSPLIRVGDGTAAGASMTATIASVLTGSSGMTKSDLGTLVLAGDNTYTGGTTISGGVLQLGEGGTSGSIVGDVADNGTLAFNRSDVQTFGGAISGSGAVTQAGSGSTVLTGTNSYAGATNVQAGTLLVNGDQTAATGATTVQSGATLGGAGIIGGDVNVANGGTLSPGAAAGAAGTLTINGNLTLGANATLDYQLGQAGTVGGASNDLTVVHGNLTLAGTLDVSATAGGSFGPGVYRIFSYDGTLTDDGLNIGTSPSSDVFVQTSLANQVNLVNSTGLTLNFWDGPGHANDGAITGGTGTWRLTDNDYWTDATGSLNAPYSNGAFAVFGGTGGTVTVDNSNGPISASGLQFQADGYRIVGGDLGLTGSAFTIRVGDGTSAGASMTATIDSVIDGAGMLVKDDLGTLVLDGANTYIGGTDVHAGTLQISSDANLGAAAGSLSIDAGTLHTTASFQSSRSVGLGGAATIETDAGTTLTLNGGMGGTGSLTKTGTGTLTLGGASSYGGATTVAAGTLSAAMANAFNASSATTVQSGATLDLGGFAQQVGALTNAGTVHFGSVPGTTLTVHGNYTGQGGTLNFNTALGGDNSPTDMLVVTGDTSGTTTVHVTNVGGAGAQTSEGIKLIDVQGASNGTFALQGNYVYQGQQAVVAGAYAYRLYQGSADTPDGDWYLRSALTNGSATQSNDPPPPLYQPGVPLYEAYAGILQQANTLDTLFERTGNRQWANGQSTGDMQPGEGVWVRTQGGDQSFKPETTTSGSDYDISHWKTEVGMDATVADGGNGRLVGGATLQYERDNSSVNSAYGQGSISTDAYGVGTSLTWYGDGGLYVDGQARWLQFESDLRSTTLGRTLENNNRGSGYAAGIEVGQRLGLGNGWSMVPQAQVTYGNAWFDGFNDVFGARVTQQNGDTGTARAGTTLDYRTVQQGISGPVVTHVYALINVYDNFKNGAQVSVDGTDFTTRNDHLWSSFGLGSALDWAGGRYSVYGEVQVQTGLSRFGDSNGLNANVGFRMRW
ncbi:autotransporter-associated beta strand repeat-containing protein [Dyella acidiphila]|uniref:Autotransporter-associated beta strand repeat-containing protein n=1 Tax=Dyella acidiphila TaxID=2775866 RepID=A0ABR9G6L0_9GAMM|nr:autotransporter-associated beta strand repeat-containing protein [Dyella acidiphila]MBE1159678.1 autotransporter-associated beta strand repeat-containing protein [Dyella acidiphila]